VAPAKDDEPDGGEPVALPIDGTLDLHAFRPAELQSLLEEWLLACRDAGIREVRIVHGKGTGALRRRVEALLSRSPLVASFRAAGEDAGGWGATLATLRPPET
jgi:DNA-nicking Smr family endonuclease